MSKREEKLKEKFFKMREYEKKLYSGGIKNIAGIDEVGRGPLAGPVVAAAVVLPEAFAVLGVDDSKKLSAKKRMELYDIITREAVAYDIGMIENSMIDEVNILEATKLAMREALRGVAEKVEIDHVLVDAVKLDLNFPCTSIVKGDEKSISIAASSIVAKVVRDEIMRNYNELYPGYAFDSNKGYGTKAHYEGINELGICPIHRRTYLKGVL